MAKKDDIYGTLHIGTPGTIETVLADRIHGARILRQDGEFVGVEVQFQSAKNVLGLAIPKLDALFLLSLLKSIQLDEEVPFPDDPRDPNWRAGDHS